MKKNLLKSVILLLGAAVMAVAFASCDKDPVKPNPKDEPKLHEDPVKVSIQLVECHMHGSWNNIDLQGGPHQDPETKAKYLCKVQTVTYELKQGKGWQVPDGSQSKFYVLNAHDYGTAEEPNPAPIYLMLINYYNIKGELMNEQFVLNNQDAIHQHFFTLENKRGLLVDTVAHGSTTDFMEYKYVDTTPWDSTFHSGKAQLTGRTNPIGLKGALRFLKNRVTMDLRIRLLHDNRGKKDPKTGTFSPSYAPSSSQIQNGSWDINFIVPVVVYAEQSEFIEELPINIEENEIEDYVNGKSEADFSEASNQLLRSIMKSFDITWKDALTDYCKLIFTAGDAESGAIWL